MNPIAEKFDLRANQFAVLFETDRGIEADDLGTFLKRAATLARQQGAELRVVRFEPGSLATIFEALQKSKIAKNAKKEFVQKPIAGTAAITGIVAAVAGALIWSFDTEKVGPTPISRAGATVIEERNVTAIKLVTVENVVVLMDEEKARYVREIDSMRKTPRMLEHQEIRMLKDRASGGSLGGGVISIDGELHFRPDEYRFIVPIDFARMDPRVEVYPNAHFRISGEFIMRNGRPDSIIIRSAKQD